MRKRLALALIVLLVVSAAAQERIADDINWRIRKEATENSQIMRTMHYLTDIYGGRLTGSPQLKAAGEWAAEQMQAWGLVNAHLEPWNFGHPGWTNERYSGYMISPARARLAGEVVAWTPGTNGEVRGAAVTLVPPERPTREQLAAYLDAQKNNVRGKMVLVGAPRQIPVAFNPTAKRRDDADVRTQYDPNNPNAGQFGPPQAQQPPQRQEGILTARQINEAVDAFLVANGALVRLNDAGRALGQLIIYGNSTFDIARSVPTVVLRNEDYARIGRILGDGKDVQLEFNISNRTYPEGATAYNVIAEIPGTDPNLKDQVVMLGGHLDSWHAATGATDNAIGCATMMEAARILKAIGVRPRRTIRVALWSGEEQGIWGSQAYVAEHFGSFENPKPEFAKLDAYLNIDSGTGRARGAGVFGPPEAGTLLRQVLAPFADLGVVGAVATKGRRIAGTDSTSFNNAGLPGIGFGQDPIEYNTHTHHTDLDTYERIVPEDARASSIAIASVLYHLAMRDAMVPRFSREQMPAPVPSTMPLPGTPAAAAAAASGQ